MTRPCTLPSKPSLLFHIQHMSLSACGNMPGIDVVWYVPDICWIKLKDAAETPSYTFCLDPLIHKHCWLGASGESCFFVFFVFFWLSSRKWNCVSPTVTGVVLTEAVFFSLEVSDEGRYQSFYLDNSLSGKSEAISELQLWTYLLLWMGLWKVCDVAFKGALGLHPAQKQRGFGPNWWQQRPNSAPSLFHTDIVHILGHICPSVSWNCCWHPYKHWMIAHAIICTWIWS